MSNKKVVETYIDGFNKSDHAQILSCLTDDVIWEMLGLFMQKKVARSQQPVASSRERKRCVRCASVVFVVS